MNEKLLIAKGSNDVYLDTAMLNRHGLITGATGTGKTVSLKVVAEKLSKSGINVFMADIKGDLMSLAQAGEKNEKINERISTLNLTDYENKSFPVEVWDVFAKVGHPIRTTISEIGPLFLSRILGLTEAQEGILNIAFRVADEEGLLLIDIKDLRSMLVYLYDNAKSLSLLYGNISVQSIGAIQRRLLVLEEQGGNIFFGETAIELSDFFRKSMDGRGIINILYSRELIQNPLLYSTFLFWMLAELNENLPEVGDIDKPKLVFFFDEAHLLFDNIPKALEDLIRQIVKLIRSKGVGVFFVTQSPADIPESVLAQLGNKIQHALRAYTPKELKAIRAVADSFRANPAFDTESEIPNLRIGEALISVLDSEGRPTMVEKAFVLPPMSLLGSVDNSIGNLIAQNSPLYYKYKDYVDRKSAYEILTQRINEKLELEKESEMKKLEEAEAKRIAKENEKAEKERLKEEARIAKEQKAKNAGVKKLTNSLLTSITRSIGSSIGRTIFGTIKKGF